MTFTESLNACIDKNNSLLCVGLDPDITKLPERFKTETYPQYAFNQWIIDLTVPYVCTFKLNSAFYEMHGAQGIEELQMTTEYIHKMYPDIPVILDAKRGDIGNTNDGYAHFAFDYLKADAITLQPYMGGEALKPFLDRKEKGCIILCRTSNAGAQEFQDLMVNNEPLYLQVARKATKEWNINGNCMLVVGATYPEEIKKVREVVGDMTLLVPGIGAQGGDLKATLEAGLIKAKGVIINAARSIIFAEDPKKEAMTLRDQINSYRTL